MVSAHLLPVGPPDAIVLGSADLGFSEVFGPVCEDVVVVVPEKKPVYELVKGDGEGKVEKCCSEDVVASESVVQACIVSSKEVGLDEFELLKVVGEGAFGRVFQVQKIDTSEIFAMKVMRKDKILKKNHAEYMIAERAILTKIDHPFIVQLRYSFQTKYRLYLVLDFVNGGHLFFQLHHQGLFREDLALIYTAEIVSAVSYLHEKGIMHRDLKPENVLLDAEGHVVLADFGLEKQFDETTRSNSMCGTLEYMAPEIVLGKGHNKAVDWWSKDPSKHLGSGAGGGGEIKAHKWFRSINWKKLEAREIQSSFHPEVAGKRCTANFDERWTSMALLVDSPVASPKTGGETENSFRDFTYHDSDNIFPML
nr:serine/threonine-protein kinase AtPK2/AtPK19-like [Ipomoea batatas]